MPDFPSVRYSMEVKALLRKAFGFQVTSARVFSAVTEMTRQADLGAKGIHIPSLKIERFRSIRNLELPRVGQVNLFAGDNGLVRSSLLGSVARHAVNGTRAFQPSWWDHAAIDNDDEMLVATTYPSESLVMDAGEPFEDDRIEIRRLTANLTPMMRNLGTDWYFFVADRAEVFKAGGLIEPKLLDPKLRSLRRTAHLESSEMFAISEFVIRDRSGRFDLGWLIGSGEGPQLEFVDVLEVGWDTVKTVVLMSAISDLPEPETVGWHKSVLLIDDIDLTAKRHIHASFWELVTDVMLARKAQLFATTNSPDCIAGFADAGVERPDASLLFFRLEHGEQQTHWVDYDPVTLQVSFDTGIDPR